jgi:CDP-diacylglycerol--serine O-phosphatidyltransferase
LFTSLQLGEGWWSAPVVVGVWMLVAAGLMVSRLPTLSFKTVRVAPRLIAPLLVLVGLLAAVLVTAPFLTLAAIGVLYLCALPYTVHRHRWLSRHPEAWDVPGRERRAVVRAARSARRLGLRPPLRRRVAGRASEVAGRARGAVAGAVRRLGDDGPPQRRAPGPGPAAPPPDRNRLGLRRARRR